MRRTWQERSAIYVQRVSGAALLAVLSAALAFLILSKSPSPQLSVQAAAKSSADRSNPDERCAQCHSQIYKRYEHSAMAVGSGPARENLLPGGFHHEPSGVDYRIDLDAGVTKMLFHRDANSSELELTGEREFSYFIGSGAKGRTYLYQQHGFWYELPINYYTRKGGWDMAPAYENTRRMPGPLSTDPNCLHCHATDISASEGGAANHLGAEPFHQGGVGCSACHGDPSAHLAQGGHGPIANPGKMTPNKRDSACLQCHLEGNAVVYRPGRSLASFKTGEDLNGTALYFVYASQAMGGSRATSQFEALLQSACMRAVGDKLTCTTCHDPHGDPPAAERVSYFRARCLSCHTDAKLATQHHPEQQNCASCHMPTRDTADISHEQVTDHNIERLPSRQVPIKHLPGEELVVVGGQKAGDRELGLAYAQLAQRGDRKAGERALELLSRAEKSGSQDEQVHLNLGFLLQVSGNTTAARAEYEAAIAENPSEATALSNLAALKVRDGNGSDALALLRRAVLADPAQTAAGLNLAFLECTLGQVQEAREAIAGLHEFDPDSAKLAVFLRTGVYGGQRCDAMKSENHPAAPALHSLPQ